MGAFGTPGTGLRRSGRRRIALAAAVALAGAGLAGGAVLAAGPAAAQPGPACPAPVVNGLTAMVTCVYTGAAQYWTPPTGVTSATFTLYGAEGATTFQPDPASQLGVGGKGAEVTATLPVTPGITLQVNVGQYGTSNDTTSFGGGGAGGSSGPPGSQLGGGGGGASDVRSPADGYSLADRILVAAGGGGAGALGVSADTGIGYESYGGTGGNSAGNGGNGQAGLSVGAPLGGGVGGTAPSGTAPGTGPGSGGSGGSLTGPSDCNSVVDAGTTGDDGGTGTSQGDGGDGASETLNGTGGGGGGGGYWGGGGGGGGAYDGCADGAAGGGGGGGSSYTSGIAGATVVNGVAPPDTARDGEVIITYQLLGVSTTSLPDGGVGDQYSATLTAVNGTAPYTWGITAGSLPPGLTLDSMTGVISGTPTQAGTYAFTVQVTDANDQVSTEQLSILVLAPPSITTTSLPEGVVNSGYSQTVTATGGTTPYTWSVSSGSLPPGLSLGASTGTISGTPTQAGTYGFTVKVTDSTTPAGLYGTAQLSITVVEPLAIPAITLPDGVVGSSYGQTVTATGGTTPYTWSVSSGSLPPGLSLVPAAGSAATAAISGTPATPGTYAFTVKVTDSTNPVQTATQELSITVLEPLSVTTTGLPAATGGQAYTATLAAAGGVSPYTWSVTSGSLPPGLTLNATTGVITGTPDVTGTYQFTVTVKDSESPTAMTASKTLSISVSGPTITALKPDSGPVYGDTPVEITGTGLSCPAGQAGCKVTVTFGGKPAIVVLVRSDEIFVVSPAAGTLETVTVTVTVGGVSSQATPACKFTYVSPVG